MVQPLYGASKGVHMGGGGDRNSGGEASVGDDDALGDLLGLLGVAGDRPSTLHRSISLKH